jgi:succinate dehydrogenase / fumarate reductase cytochrome b subunit
MQNEVLDQSRGGVWAWLFQRITAVLLIAGFASHLISTHIMAIGELSYDNIAHRLASGFFSTMDVVLLAAVLFHALNGARMVVLDYWLSAKAQRRALSLALWAFGAAAFVYGLWALWPWIKG